MASVILFELHVTASCPPYVEEVSSWPAVMTDRTWDRFWLWGGHITDMWLDVAS